MSKKILIVGGGIGGLTLAACLKKRGIQATVIEKCPEWKTIGYVLGLFPNGLSILRYLGVHQTLIEKGKILNHYTIRNIQDHDMWGFPFSELGSDLPAIETERSTLHFTLVDLNKDTDIRMNTTLAHFTEDVLGVDVVLSDGTKDRYDLVVAADGIGSSIRKEIAPKIEPAYTGLTFWLVWMPRPEGVPDEVVQYIGRKKFFSIFPSKKPEHATAAFFGVSAREHSYTDPQMALKEIEKDFKGKNPVIDEILKHFPNNSAEIFHHDDDEVKHGLWYKNRIVLLGDAVHALSPILGMGASTAMEDAYVLAEEIAQNDSIDQALFAYWKRRYKRIAMLKACSAFIHKAIAAKGVFALLKPSMIARVVGPSYRKVVKHMIRVKP